MRQLGIDIGGSGIKGAIIDTATGELVSERHRIPTPKPASPNEVAKTIKKMVKHFDWKHPVGCSFPTVVIDGKCHTGGNLSPKWVGVRVDELFSNKCSGLPFFVANDADLAGVAEIKLGAGVGLKKKVVMITIGTGIGSGVFYHGELIPNIELGRIYYTDGKVIERFTSDATRKRENLSLKKWAQRFDIFLRHVQLIASPDHFIIGGGLSKKFDEFKKYLTVETPVTVAHFKNNAGIIGAALYAELNLK